VRHAAPEISLISFELSMLPQLVRMIVQPETLGVPQDSPATRTFLMTARQTTRY
jgi:hypothetical protein